MCVYDVPGMVVDLNFTSLCIIVMFGIMSLRFTLVRYGVLATSVCLQIHNLHFYLKKGYEMLLVPKHSSTYTK